ncbi:MAG: methionine--tRNA ligase, partial [Candidatus Nanohaloarchaea archaeon]|nr:methionine--tRNA ligase [Candidatus Nanohaloarchaea archaeon]
QFQELDLRIGTIQSVEEHPNADELYLLTIVIGDEEKQSCAGLVGHYDPDELEGRRVVVLNNLETSEIRGEESQCMVLAADDGDAVVLLEPEDVIEEGAEVR